MEVPEQTRGLNISLRRNRLFNYLPKGTKSTPNIISLKNNILKINRIQTKCIQKEFQNIHYQKCTKGNIHKDKSYRNLIHFKSSKHCFLSKQLLIRNTWVITTIGGGRMQCFRPHLVKNRLFQQLDEWRFHQKIFSWSSFFECRSRTPS